MISSYVTFTQSPIQPYIAIGQHLNAKILYQFNQQTAKGDLFLSHRLRSREERTKAKPYQFQPLPGVQLTGEKREKQRGKKKKGGGRSVCSPFFTMPTSQLTECLEETISVQFGSRPNQRKHRTFTVLVTCESTGNTLNIEFCHFALLFSIARTVETSVQLIQLQLIAAANTTKFLELKFKQMYIDTQ